MVAVLCLGAVVGSQVQAQPAEEKAEKPAAQKKAVAQPEAKPEKGKAKEKDKNKGKAKEKDKNKGKAKAKAKEKDKNKGKAKEKEKANDKDKDTGETAEQPPVDPKKEARRAYREGKKAFMAGDHEAALRSFEASYEYSPSPNSRLMKARTLNMLGRRPEALYELRQTVQEAEKSGKRKYRASARSAKKQAEELEKELATVTVTIEVEDAEGEAEQEARLQGAVLTVGGVRIERDRWSDPIPVEPGSVQVALDGPEGQSEASEVEVKVGEVAAVPLKLAAPPVPEPVVEPEPPPPPVRVEADSGKDHLRVIGLLAGGVGVVGMVVFGACGAASNSKFNDLEEACPSRTGCDPALRHDADTGDTLQTAANVGLVVGVLGIAAGVTLFVLGSVEGESEVALGPGSISVKGNL